MIKKIIAMACVLGGLLILQIYLQIYQPQYFENEINIVIPKGSGSSAVATILKEAGLIKRPWLFKLAARLLGSDKDLKAGEYAFLGEFSIKDIINKIAVGDIVYHKITLAEGLTTAQMLKIIYDEPFLSGEISSIPEEGELLPETYHFARGDSKESLIEQAKTAMEKVLEEAWQNRDEKLPLKDKQQLLTLASIVEKETGISSERTLVASVFVNRLRKGMKLQTDPTVIYALTYGQEELNRALTRKDLEIDNPYNTYKYYGLPPAPICNPGRKAIEAAANPEISNYLYFVANGQGGHNFAVSLDEHNRNVKKWKNGQK